MNPDEIYRILLESSQPDYSKKFGLKLSKNVYNISSLVGGAKSYIRTQEAKTEHNMSTRKMNVNMLRGSAIDRLVKESLPDWSNMDYSGLHYYIPYKFKTGEESIHLVGHVDLVKDNVVIELKTTKAKEGQTVYWEKWNTSSNPYQTMLTKAKRQVAAYSKILSLQKNLMFEAFVAVINDELRIFKLTNEEIETGWQFILRSARQVAEILDQ